jgi:hypothetical protein
VLGAVTAPSLLIVSSFFSARRNLPLGKIVISITAEARPGNAQILFSDFSQRALFWAPAGIWSGPMPSPALCPSVADARGKRLPPRRSGGFSPSALIYPDFYLIIAWFAEHFIAFAFFDVPLPFLIWHAEHFRPKFTALGTHIWIHDEWDTALIIQRTFPLLSLFGS